jgi:hypothetical protein
MASNDDDMRNEVPKQIQKSKRLDTFRERQRERERRERKRARARASESARARESERERESTRKRDRERERGYWAIGRSLTDMPTVCQGQ